MGLPFSATVYINVDSRKFPALLAMPFGGSILEEKEKEEEEGEIIASEFGESLMESWA